MKPSFPFVRIAAVCGALAVASSGFAAVSIGQAAPDFSLAGIDGQTHHLSDYSGKIVVLEWNNPDCPIVAKHYLSGNLPGMQQAATAQGVVWLLVNSAGPGREGGDYTDSQLKAWLQARHSNPTAYLRDPAGTVGHAYGAKTTPHIFIINPAGQLVYEGGVDSIRSADQDDIPRAVNYVKAALTQVEAGQPVAKPTSQPYGCSVKYASAD